MVFKNEEFKNNSDSFTKLNKRNTSLQRQRKNSEDLRLSGKEENEFQSNISLMRNLKRIIYQVSFPSSNWLYD